MAKRGRKPQPITYDRALIKRVNERIRKKEKVYGFDPEEYYNTHIRKMLIEQPNNFRAQAYKSEMDLETGIMKIRLLNKTEFEAASDEVKKLVLEEANLAMKAQTMTKTGADQWRENQLQTWLNNPVLENIQEFGLTREAWKSFKNFVEYAKSQDPNFSEEYAYDVFTSLLVENQDGLQTAIENGTFDDYFADALNGNLSTGSQFLRNY